MKILKDITDLDLSPHPAGQLEESQPRSAKTMVSDIPWLVPQRKNDKQMSGRPAVDSR